MRILLASGEEAVYRTVEELALGISSGMITADARFFDSPSQGWRAIDSHPEYHEAIARAATLGAGIEVGPLYAPTMSTAVIPGIKPHRGSVPFQIYQMFSLSAAELQAKRRPAWLLPALAGVAGLGLLLSLFLVLRSGKGNSTSAEEIPSLAVRAIPVSGPQLPSPLSVEAMRLAPMNLNSHLSFTIEAAGRRLSDTAEAIGASNLLSRGRQLATDSVRQTRALLAALRQMVSGYRAAQQHARNAYRDTAAMLVKSGFWSKIDQQEWKVYPMVSESPQEAAQADSLLDSLQELYDLLDEQPHAYREIAGRIQFDDPTSSQQYERLRGLLSRYEAVPDSSVGRTTAFDVLRRATASRYPRP